MGLLGVQTVRRAVKARVTTANVPPSVKGWNTRDALAEMDPQEAVILDNYFPEATFLRLRGGFTSHATGIGGQIDGLFTWTGPAGAKMFAAKSTAIYNVTSAGAVGAAEISGLTNGRWQSVNFTTSGGSFLVIANGADSVRNYDGASWTTPAITGVTSSTLVNVASHKQRLWFVEASSTKAWYLPTSAIAGAATSFELGSVFKAGGKLKLIGTLSQDAGDGMDDFIVFVSSVGELAIYHGSDPSSAATWALVGTFRVGAPIGDRALVQVAGDLGMISEDGVISIQQMLRLDRAAASQAAITNKISAAFSDAFQSYGSNYGWQAVIYPRGHRVLFNIPLSTTSSHQYVMNTQTGAWCRFTGMNATSWALLSENLYFGGNGTVYRADNGSVDVSSNIVGEVLPAFNYLGSRGTLKRITMMRPNFNSNGLPGVAVRINTDFAQTAPTPDDVFPLSAAVGASLWDAAVWDTAVWGGVEEIFANWLTAGGIGYAASPHLITRTSGMSIQVNGFDLMFERMDRMSI